MFRRARPKNPSIPKSWLAIYSLPVMLVDRWFMLLLSRDLPWSFNHRRFSLVNATEPPRHLQVPLDLKEQVRVAHLYITRKCPETPEAGFLMPRNESCLLGKPLDLGRFGTELSTISRHIRPVHGLLSSEHARIHQQLKFTTCWCDMYTAVTNCSCSRGFDGETMITTVSLVRLFASKLIN